MRKSDYLEILATVSGAGARQCVPGKHAARPWRLAGTKRRNSSRAMERAHEIGDVAEADIERDIGNSPVVGGEQPRGVAQS